MRRARALNHLAACLAGTPPAGCDWAGVLALANQGLATPQLASALAAAASVPDDVAGFLAEVARRNRERNRRLRDALAAAVSALNGAGIRPGLLKGAAHLVDGADARLMCDLDLL